MRTESLAEDPGPQEHLRRTRTRAAGRSAGSAGGHHRRDGVLPRVGADPRDRQSILDRIKLGDLAPAVECRILDHAWGAPPKKLELSGKDGGPLEVVKVERVIVDMGNHDEEAVH